MRRRPPRRAGPSPPNAAGGPSPLVFYGLLAVLTAFFAVGVWAALDPSAPQPPPVVAAATQPPAAPSTTPSVTPSATVATSPTSAVVVVERRPPTQTPRPSLTPTAAPPATATVVPSPTQTATVTPTATVTATRTVTSTVTVTATETVTPSPTPAPIVHVVRQGDTLMALGQRYGVPWQAIAAANGLPENTVLQLDQQLVIPVPTG